MTTTSATPPPAIGSGHDGSVRDQVVNWARGVRQGEMGALPAIGGFVVLLVLFSFMNSTFLTPINLANLLTQAATLMVLAMALVFVILLGEIDLSAGVTSGVAAAIFVVAVHDYHVNWLAAVAMALVGGLLIGTFIGVFVAKVGIPSFVVTLGLFLGLQGAQLIIIGKGGAYRMETPQITSIMNDNLSIVGGWIALGIVLVLATVLAFWDRARRTRAGVVNRPIALLWARLLITAAAGGLFVALLNIDRAPSRGTLNGVAIDHSAIEGVPIVVPFVVGLLWVGTFVLDRTRFGRHLYAVGGNPEAARRAGIKIATIRIAAFIICSGLAVVSGIFDASRLGVVSASSGGQIVLNGVAAAVVGGVSLFGGRGRLSHAAIGALVIAVIANGLGLLGLPSGANYLVTGGVLILAAAFDAVSRKRAGGTLLRN